MEKFKVELSTSITEFKKNPNEQVKLAGGKCFAVLTNNKPSFFVLSPELYDELAELIWELEMAPILHERSKPGQEYVEVKIEDLLNDLSHHFPENSTQGMGEARPQRKGKASKETPEAAA